MLVVYDDFTTARLAAEQNRYFARSRELTQAAWERRSFTAKTAQSLARLLSPLL
jgi:hypothetical protein